MPILAQVDNAQARIEQGQVPILEDIDTLVVWASVAQDIRHAPHRLRVNFLCSSPHTGYSTHLADSDGAADFITTISYGLRPTDSVFLILHRWVEELGLALAGFQERPQLRSFMCSYHERVEELINKRHVPEALFDLVETSGPCPSADESSD